MGEHVLEPQPAGALRGAPLPARDQLGQSRVRRPIGGKAQQGITVGGVTRPFLGDSPRLTARTIVAVVIFPCSGWLFIPRPPGARPVDPASYGLVRRRPRGRPCGWSGRARARHWENCDRGENCDRVEVCRDVRRRRLVLFGLGDCRCDVRDSRCNDRDSRRDLRDCGCSVRDSLCSVRDSRRRDAGDSRCDVNPLLTNGWHTHVMPWTTVGIRAPRFFGDRHADPHRCMRWRS